jgi:hypothetical protein
MSNSILSQTTQNRESPDPTNAQAWLQAKVEQYQAEVTHLEAQLKHAQILLKGHQIWLAEVSK